jgi:hypothetical protein
MVTCNRWLPGSAAGAHAQCTACCLCASQALCLWSVTRLPSEVVRRPTGLKLASGVRVTVVLDGPWVVSTSAHLHVLLRSTQVADVVIVPFEA